MRIAAHRLTRKRVRPVLLGSIAALIIAQVVALSPTPLEQAPVTASSAVDPELLVPESESENQVLAEGIPANKIPDYSVDQFNYVSTQASQKLWRLNAKKAFLYNKENLVHARTVQAQLFDPDGKATFVTGRESKYYMNKRDLEVYGDVKILFPDGFELHSEYLRYRPQERKVEIPPKYLVRGISQQPGSQRIEFESNGLDFEMKQAQIKLPSQVKFTMLRTTDPNDKTLIESDECVIYRDKQQAFFTMYPSRPVDARFIYITQPTLLSRGRKSELNYGNFDKILKYLTIQEDVLIRERPAPEVPAAARKPKAGAEKSSLRYATAGRADFDSRKDQILLTEFPQVYQDDDTVTGERIIVHRDTDVVEVEQSNAYSQGQ